MLETGYPLRRPPIDLLSHNVGDPPLLEFNVFQDLWRLVHPIDNELHRIGFKPENRSIHTHCTIKKFIQYALIGRDPLAADTKLARHIFEKTVDGSDDNDIQVEVETWALEIADSILKKSQFSTVCEVGCGLKIDFR